MGEAAVRPRTTPTTTNSCLNTQNTSNSAVSSCYTKVARLYHDSYAAVSSCYECCQAVPQQLCSCQQLLRMLPGCTTTVMQLLAAATNVARYHNSYAAVANTFYSCYMKRETQLCNSRHIYIYVAMHSRSCCLLGSYALRSCACQAVTQLLLGCYAPVAGLLRSCFQAITQLLLGYYAAVARFLRRCSKAVTQYTAVASQLRSCCQIVSQPLQSSYAAVARLLRSCCQTVTQLLLGAKAPVAWLIRSCCEAVTQLFI